MSILVGVLVALHLIGWALALGGLVGAFKAPAIPSGVLHGLYLALVSGLAITGVAGAQQIELNYLKISIKLAVAVIVTVLAVLGRRRPERVTKGYLGALAGLIVANVFLAVLW